MDTFDELRTWIAGQSALKWRADEESISVEPPTPAGFSLWITKDGKGWTTAFDGWHEHFDIESEAVHCFVWGLSGRCRLEVTYRGQSAYRWALQYESENGWQTESITGLLFFPFWRLRRIEYHRNPEMIVSF